MHLIELRFFAGEGRGEDFNAYTPTTDNPGYLGLLGLFGMVLPGEEMPKGMDGAVIKSTFYWTSPDPCSAS